MLHRRIRFVGALVAAAAAGLVVAVYWGPARLAFARTLTLKTAHNAKLGETIVVDGRGRTVYELKPETVHHLLCKTKKCLGFWPPVTVGSAHAKPSKSAGVKGKLGILHRDHFFQVTLNGVPLYRFAGDSRSGQANGQGLKSFGGTWHAVKEGSSSAMTTTSTTSSTTTTSATTSSTTTYPYPY